MTVDYAAILERWPQGPPPLPKRPADVMPFDLSDSTVLVGARQFAW